MRLSQNQLLNERHLFWQRNQHRFFLAYQGNRCTGRIAAFINKEHNQYHGSQQACFGFLESENNTGTFRKLLGAAEEFARQNSCSLITGPLNPSLHYELGVLVNGFDYPPYFMLLHNYPYYDEQIRRAGYSKAMDFYSYKLDGSQYVPTEKMQRVSSFLKNRYQIQIRSADIKFFDRELDILYSIYNEAFTGHWGFTPMERKEFYLLAKDLKSIIDPRMILIAEVRGEPVGFTLCVPNWNEVFINIRDGRLFPWGIFKILAGKKIIKSVRVITAAVKKSHEHVGLGSLFYPELMRRGQKYGYHECELSWVAENNHVMNRIAGDLGAQPYKTYRLYSKAV